MGSGQDLPTDELGAEPAWDVALLFPAQGLWTAADYLALNTNRLVELSGGVVEVPETPTNRHQAIVAFLFTKLLAFVSTGALGTVRFAPLPVRLWPGKFREPDLVFMAAGHQDRIGELYWGVPDLVMEVVSPGTRRLDEVTKVKEYAEAGVAEYWIVDLESEAITLYVRAASAFERRTRAEKGEVVRSETLTGFQVAVDEVLGAR